MLKNSSRNFAALGMIAVATLGLSACGGGSEETDNAGAAPESTTGSESTTTESMAPESGEAMDPAANLVGPACADYAAAVPDGAGSVAGMAQDPVAVAASNNPMLTQLTAAVSGELNPKVDLVDTLNSGEFTVFAPVDEAFGAIPAETLETLKTDDATLSTILTYHVVSGRYPSGRVAGLDEATTVNGETVDIKAADGAVMVDGANVVMADVTATNGVIHVIDKVLMPGS